MTDEDDKPEWTILYHSPGQFKGRGEFLRLLLEDAQVAYKDTGEGLYGPNGLMDMFRGNELADFEKDHSVGDGFPCLYPPAILHRPGNGDDPVIVNQVAACMIYIGDQLGYAPTSSAERARATRPSCSMRWITFRKDGLAFTL